MSRRRHVTAVRATSTARRGFTLVEVLVAMAIVAVGLLPVLDLLAQSRRALSASQRILVLESAAMQMLELGERLVTERAHLGVPGFSPGSEQGWQGEHEGIAWELLVRATDEPGLYELTVRTESGGRWFEVTGRVADPHQGYYHAEIPARFIEGGYGEAWLEPPRFEEEVEE